MKIEPRKKLRALGSKEFCMDACLLEQEFECRSANWYRKSGDCHLSDQDRHSVSQSEAGDQRLKSGLGHYYGPAVASNLSSSWSGGGAQDSVQSRPAPMSPQTGASYFLNPASLFAGAKWRLGKQASWPPVAGADNYLQSYYAEYEQQQQQQQQQQTSGANEAPVDYLENNCIYEPNKLCEFHKIQNRILKTVDSIYQEVATLEECKQKCLNAPYRCYSFDYGDTSERVCRTSHLDQASLMSVRDPYLEVVGAITYELASCFNVSIQCRAREMVALVSASKRFRGKIYAKSRPNSCVNDVGEALHFELAMRYQDEACDVRATSNEQRGVFSNDLVIQHHDRIVTTQDVGLSVYCHYDLGNRSVTTNQVDLAIERLGADDLEPQASGGDGKQAEGAPQQQAPVSGQSSGNKNRPGSSHNSPLTITGLATTVVKSPNVTMRITNINGQPVTSATVGDRLALMFEIKEKSSEYFVHFCIFIFLLSKSCLFVSKSRGKFSAFFPT